MVPALLHLAEQHVCPNALRYIEWLLRRIGHNGSIGFVLQGEIIFYVQNANDVIQRFFADRITGMARRVDCFLPFFYGVTGAEKINFRAVCGEFFRAAVIKQKHVVDKLLFLRVEYAFSGAGVQHGLDFFLADFVVVRIGVDAQ